MPTVYRKRIQHLQTQMPGFGIDTLLVADRTNNRYLTGFACSSSLLVVDDGTPTFITDARYGEAAEQALGNEYNVVITPRQDVEDFMKDLLRKKQRNFVGYEGITPVYQFHQWEKWLEGRRFQMADKLIDGLRASKDEGELAEIRKATALADRMMEQALASLRPGAIEKDISRAIRFSSEELGGEGESFPNIVASGPNSSRPHHQPGGRALQSGDVVTIDLGGIVNGYCSDLTRTVVLGNADPEFEKIYQICLQANEAAIARIRPGMKNRDADRIARDIIEAAGYGQYFGHGLGHGVGLDIHEQPRMSPAVKDDLELPEGAVITIEPGIYLPGRFGVRIEDYVVVREGGCEVLSTAPKHLISL